MPNMSGKRNNRKGNAVRGEGRRHCRIGPTRRKSAPFLAVVASTMGVAYGQWDGYERARGVLNRSMGGGRELGV